MAADDWIDDSLDRIRSAGLLRSLRQVNSATGPEIEISDPTANASTTTDATAFTADDSVVAAATGVSTRRVLHFASNDYLGLAGDRRLCDAAARAARQYGAGSAASGLIVGHNSLISRLEEALALFKHTEAALVLPSGYMANLAIIGSLVAPGDLVLADRLCHASMIDGARLSGARLMSWRHNDVAALERKLADKSAAYRRTLVMTESVFSMDGDVAPLAEIADVCRRTGAMLLVDEAHALGLFGPTGAGLAEQLGLPPDSLTATVGTLSKALGGQGGFICGSRRVVELVINRGRALIYSTALSPMQAAAALAALEIVSSEAGSGCRRRRVFEAAGALRHALHDLGLKTADSASQIIPVILGEAARTVDISRRLWQEGIFVPAIRPPTVPRGSSRLRISLTALHTDEHIARLVEALRRTMS